MKWQQFLKTWRLSGSMQIAELFGGLIVGGQQSSPVVTLTYGPSIAIDASLGNDFVVTVTDAVAFVFAAPTNTPAVGGQVIRVTIRNGSGGAHGAGTFNAVFKASANVPAIANGQNRTICFRWNGTNWVEMYRTAADVPN